jgi:hypothetical protein
MVYCLGFVYTINKYNIILIKDYFNLFICQLFSIYSYNL